MKWFYRITNVAIVTDLPVLVGIYDANLKTKIYGKLGVWLMRKFDHYVLLTEHMRAYINKRNRPQCIMEGVYDGRRALDDDIRQQSVGKKICLYAGTLHRVYLQHKFWSGQHEWMLKWALVGKYFYKMLHHDNLADYLDALSFCRKYKVDIQQSQFHYELWD